MKAVAKQATSDEPGPISREVEINDQRRKPEIVVLSQREFVRGCVAFWLAAACSEYSVTIATETLPDFMAVKHACPVAILIDASGPELEPGWIEEQVAAQRAQETPAPVVLIVDPKDADRAKALVIQLNLGGYIPTSHTTGIAAAALRLIIAGATYLPYDSVGVNGFPAARQYQIQMNPAVSHRSLTSREQAVLKLLEAGMPNKTIARQLGLSLSTVKIHVHHIIRKFNVQNRTEAVIIAAKYKSLSLEILLKGLNSEHIDGNLVNA